MSTTATPVTPPPAPVPAPTVAFTFEDALAIAEKLGMAATLINPALGGAVAAATGILTLLEGTVIPAIRNGLSAHVETIAQQALLQAQSAVERARVGAPAATVN